MADNWSAYAQLVRSGNPKASGIDLNLAALKHFVRDKRPEQADAVNAALLDAIQSGKLNSDIAAIEGTGAMAMYEYLLGQQVKSMGGLKSLLGGKGNGWELPPLPATPFSPEKLAGTEEEEGDIRHIDPEDALDPIEQSIAITEGIVTSAQMLQSIDTLEEIPRQESIEEARKILRGLRNMQFSDRSLEEFMDHGTPPTIVAKKKSLQTLVHVFALFARQAQERNAEATKSDPAVQNARQSVNTIALEVAEHTRRMLKDKDEREAKLDALIDAINDEALLRQNQSVERLLDNVELGLERVSGQTVEFSPLERLIEARDRLEESSRELSAPDSMESPVREESIELARDILRRLQNMPFSEQPLAVFMEKGRAEDKAAFAQQVDEAVEIYKNLLAEASQSNPGIRQDAQVQEAANVVETFLHSVKLMAAKEMPSSIASAQHISSEAAQDPAQWGELHQHAVNRLVKSAEGALEKAIAEVAQDQEQDQAEEQSREAAEQALQQADQAKRKKKRRKGGDAKPRSGKGGKKNRKLQMDFTADDQALGQGAYAKAKPIKSETKANPAMSGLKESDLAAIRELGGTLRDLNTLSATLTVSQGDKIVPDDKTLTERLSDREKQQQQNPGKGGQGPGV